MSRTRPPLSASVWLWVKAERSEVPPTPVLAGEQCTRLRFMGTAAPRPLEGRRHTPKSPPPPPAPPLEGVVGELLFYRCAWGWARPEPSGRERWTAPLREAASCQRGLRPTRQASLPTSEEGPVFKPGLRCPGPCRSSGLSAHHIRSWILQAPPPRTCRRPSPRAVHAPPLPGPGRPGRPASPQPTPPSRGRSRQLLLGSPPALPE